MSDNEGNTSEAGKQSGGPDPIPDNWRLVMDKDAIHRSLTRLSFEIVERKRDLRNLAIVGIRTGGEHLGRRLLEKIQEIEKIEIPFGVIDITLYRDDLSQSQEQPTLKGTELPFQVSGSRIVLVDDVLFTGRTVRAALDAIIDFGRPACVELAVLADRGHRELPIGPDYIGKNVSTTSKEFVRLRLKEEGHEDALYVAPRTR